MGSKEIVLGNVNEDAELLKAHAEVYNHLFAYTDTLALRSAVELHIADIIHSHGQPMSLSQIASKLESPSPDVTCLARVMRMLVRKNIFTVDCNQSSGEEVLYGLTNISRWLLHDHELSLAPMFLTFTHPWIINAWYEISSSIKEGGTPFEKAYGQSFWERASKDPEFNNMFNIGMAAATKPTLDAVVKGYKDGFSGFKGTLVDVGGGIGRMIAKIVKAYPHIKGINFDLPHVVGTAPQYPGVTHVGGDMFKEIPTADAIIFKSVLHDWADEECLAILKNCKKALSQEKGKVIIVDVILHADGKGLFDDAVIGCDLWLMADCVGGKERTEDEWKKLLIEAGFTHLKITPLPTIMSLSIIEAFPQ
ncbi:hypothetical protein BVRB_9g205500 [Beta vulgaris subsp. vulgaris]|uniref:(R,S)-reticuline 7-O-methyltransferase n=1 Tax=Beta vulgaris subsp. vulgaris TaxID=3555 RepID=UPI0005401692|nr:(R,S)-reticuline 7-O-methyltransferase [Beta vulgaris subsp. vulgaris]KMT02325.1 hypothetical protein BVRB_9g205500 [Beta vulgaris subsp. vulgaris]